MRELYKNNKVMTESVNTTIPKWPPTLVDNHFASVAVTGHKLVFRLAVSATTHAALFCHGLLQKGATGIPADSCVLSFSVPD